MSSNSNNFTFAEKLGFEGFSGVATYFGADALGAEYICYIKCDRQAFEKMKQDYLHQQVVSPKSYGEIIYKDLIAEPDEKAKAFLKKWAKENI